MLAAGFVLPLHAQVYEVDDDFAPVFRNDDVTPLFLAMSDGSLWVAGAAFVDDTAIDGVVRFQPDGTIDTQVPLPFRADAVLDMVESEGAVIVRSDPHLVRILADGTVDAAYEPPTIWNSGSGKLHPSYAGGVLLPTTGLQLADGSMLSRHTFARLEANGHFDASFPDLPYHIQGVDDAYRIYALAGRQVKRFLPTGLPDPAWTEVEQAEMIRQFLVDPAGGGLVRLYQSFVRLDASGAQDPAFDLLPEDVGRASFDESLAEFLPDGRIILLLSTTPFFADDPAAKYVVRVQEDGEVDTTFTPPYEIGRGFGFWNGRPLVRFHSANARPRFAGRLLDDGQLDPAWSPRFGRHGTLSAIRTDIEGRILVAGYFNEVEGEPRRGIVRFLPGGALDTSFAPPLTAPVSLLDVNDGYDRIRIGRDGSIFLYTLINSSPSSPDYAAITRLTASGAMHPDQVPTVTGAHDASATADGALYYTRPYSYPNAGTGGGVFGFDLVRRAPGSDVDEVLPVDFREIITTTPSAYAARMLAGSSLEVMEDDRILTFIGLQSAPEASALISADGSEAMSLPLPIGTMQSRFPLYTPTYIHLGNGLPHQTARRVLSDGTLDTDFAPPLALSPLAVLAEDRRGGAIAWRWNESVTTGTVVRLRGDGSLDPGLSHAGTDVIAAATAEDHSVYVLSYDRLVRLELETRETVMVDLSTPELVAGRPAILSANVGVPGEVTWRWQRDGVDVPDATSATLVLQPARLRDSGTYQAFAVVDGLSLASPPIELVVQAPSARLVNLSARTLVSAEESQQIAGFVLAHPAQLLVRGVGPTLASMDIEQPLAAPQLVLRDVDRSEVARNDAGWGGTAALQAAFDRTGAFPLPQDSADAALLASLPEGSYTALISGSNEGIGLAEIYLDATDSAAPLANLSIRSRVGSGEATVIAGFVVAGDGPQRLLVRAVGPSLVEHGVTDPTLDPSFAIYQGDAILLENDHATNDARAAEEESGAFPLLTDAGDAADVVYLEPGLYTVLVSGESGIVLVEIYALPPI